MHLVFTNGDAKSLRSMMEPMMEVLPYLTDESVINQTECCYAFDSGHRNFPKIREQFKKNH
jgi:hypothetical protein